MTDDVSAYLDGELDEFDRAVFVAALEQDADLRAELDEIDEVRALVRGLDPPAMPEDFVDRLLAVGAADADAAVTSAAASAPVVDLEAARTRRLGWTRFAAAAVGVAAAGAIVLAVALPGPDRSAPALATQVRVHQAATAASGDPVSGLAPLAGPVRFGR